MQSVPCTSDNAFSKSGFQCSLYALNLVLIPHHRVPVCCRTVCGFFLHLSCLPSCLLVFLSCFLCPCVHLCPPDTPTTLPPSTTPPLHPNPADHTVLLGTRASDPALTGDRGTVPPHTSPQALLHDPLRFPLRFSCSSALRMFPFALQTFILCSSICGVKGPRFSESYSKGVFAVQTFHLLPPWHFSVLLCPEPQRSKCHVQLKMSGHRRRLITAPNPAFALR